ncbi:GAF domain-containing protein [Frondihabitans sp. PAMC 28766]|uniref:GAF domain-containing protein n=1 Tax=Frondihabitans sp. PAMC 28766 TaxID=1795630 RepID=UPI0012FFC8EE|nr:GAF domain-containing protein [Frondihabitans sp. PAMC 28766]
MALPAQRPGSHRYRTADDYLAWAGLLAAPLARDMARADPLLDKTVGADGPRGTAPVDRADDLVDMTVMSRLAPETARVRREGPQQEDERQAALDALRLLDTTPETSLDDIVGAARAAFGTRFAAFTLIDHDRQWIKSRVGFDGTEGHRVDDLCVLTVQQGSVLVIADVASDARFGAQPGDGQDPGVGFFAGQAVESPSGHRIGVLCVFDPSARDVGSLEPTQLAGFAHAIAGEVWRRGTGAETAGPGDEGVAGAERSMRQTCVATTMARADP